MNATVLKSLKLRTNLSFRILSVLILVLLSLDLSPVFALTPSQVFAKVKNTVVVVKTLDAQGQLKVQGSGVLISSSRIATNCHVLEGGISYKVGQREQLVPATLYAADVDRDICLLTAKGIDGKPAQVGKAAGLKVGDPVYAVGAPRGLELSLSSGIVAQLRGGPPPLIQMTAAISPGSSGGGLFNGEGKLVGLTTLYMEGGQSLNFAMPAEWIGDVKQGRKADAKGQGQTVWVKRAMALEDSKDWEELLDWSQKWTKAEPNNKHSWFTLGGAYHKLARYDDAIETYRHVLTNDPQFAQAWFWLGGTYAVLNRYDDAIEAFRQALSIDSQDAKYWYNLGTVYSCLMRYDDAIKAYRQALIINPQYVTAWNNLAVTYVLSGNRTAALDAVRELRRFDPESADNVLNLVVPR